MRHLWIVMVIFFTEALASVPVVNLEDNWLVFESSYRSYVPYIPTKDAPKVLYFSLKPSKYKGDTLQFASQKGLCLYLNYRLIYQNTNHGETLVKIPVSKLSTSITSDSVLLAFYKSDGLRVKGLKAHIMTAGKRPNTSSILSLDFLKIKLRKEVGWHSVLLLSVLSIFVLLTISKVLFPEDSVNFLQLFGVNYTTKNLPSAGFMNGIMIVKIIINSICISTFIYFILNTDFGSVKFWTQTEGNFLSYWNILFWAIFVHILKFTYNYLCANFSHTTHLLAIQNGMFVNLFYVVNLLLLTLLIASNFSPSISSWVALQSGQIIVFYLITPVFFLILNIIRRSGLRNVYLFSYICTAEILPLLVALKFLT